jgi:outer membrane protein with beta-barrel domain
MGIRGLAIALLLLSPVPAAAEWQVRPYIGFTFGGTTTFTDPEKAAGEQQAVVGVSGGWLGQIFGFEGDFGLGPGFFETGDSELVIESGVRTLTGNVVIALPKAMAEYGLRPYFVGGAGLIHVNIKGFIGALDVNRTLPAMNIGGGVTGFLTQRIGLNWDVRRFSTLRGEGETAGNSFGNEQLSFWRATMAVAVRY